MAATLHSLEQDARNAFEEYAEQIKSGEMDVFDAAHDAFGDGVIYTADQIDLAKEYRFAGPESAKYAEGAEELISLAHEGNPDWAEYTGRVANAIGLATYEAVFNELAQEQEDE